MSPFKPELNSKPAQAVKLSAVAEVQLRNAAAQMMALSGCWGTERLCNGSRCQGWGLGGQVGGLVLGRQGHGMWKITVSVVRCLKEACFSVLLNTVHTGRW